MSKGDGSPDITVLLRKWGDGNEQARDEVIRAVYDELRAIAHNRLNGGFAEKTLNTTDLVHETYLKLVRSAEVPWASRAHFFAIAARQMRQILVDRARKRSAEKRGGGLDPRTFDESLIRADDPAKNMVEIDRVLGRLAKRNERAAKVVEMRFFVGMTMKEIACVLGSSLATIERDWTMARAWLMRELSESTS